MSIFTYSPSTVSVLTPSVVVDSVVSPIISPVSPIIVSKPYLSVYPSVAISTYTYPGYSSAFYYDSGIGDNPYTQHEINKDLRYKFLDKYLHEDYPEILRMLKYSDGSVSVLSKNEAEKNDISKDTESVHREKVDFIGSKILTYSKNQKILQSIVNKNAGIKFYDLPHNSHYVKKEQAKYIMKKLKNIEK